MPTSSQQAGYRASQNLQERAHERRESPAAPNARDRRRIKWWIDTYFGRSRAQFHRFLTDIAVAPENFGFLLQSDQASSQSVAKPKRRARLKSTYNASSSHPTNQGGIAALCKEYFDHSTAEFLACLDRCERRGLVCDPTALLSDFLYYLYNKVAPLLTPTLILEANIFTPTGLERASAKKTFELFISSLADDTNKGRIWEKYPVMHKRLLITIENATEMCIETVSRITRDREFIENSFGIARKNMLRSVSWGRGDSHCRGRVVAILKFKNAMLVYKPRSVKIDQAYNAFISWYGKKCAFRSPKSHRVLDKQAYGYAEYITAKNARSKADIASYYHKQGQLLAIAWVLGITDLHHENLIASGGDPYLIDLETMFDRIPAQLAKTHPLGTLYAKSMGAFLFRTGLLPARRRGEFGVYDTSAIGASGPQAAPVGMPMIKNLGRADIKVVARKSLMPIYPNKPTLPGFSFKAHRYTNAIVAGFQTAMRVMQEHEKPLLAKRGPLKAFAVAQIRWVPRDTAVYAQILHGLNHPSVLKDAIEADLMIGGTLNGDGAGDYLRPLLASEMADLWQNDIPYFSTQFDTTDLTAGSGRTIRGFFAETCLAGICRRLSDTKKLSAPQTDAIRLAMESTLSPRRARPALRKRLNRSDVVSSDEMLATAVTIGRNILNQKIDVDHQPFWAGLTAVDDTSFTATVLPSTIYDGAPGIGIFLAQLYRLSGAKEFQTTAREIHKFVRFLMQLPEQNQACGAFNGFAGLLYADLLISEALVLPVIENAVVLRRLENLVGRDQSFDVMSGAAGALIVAIRLFRRTQSESSYRVAKTASEILMKNAEPQAMGVAWNTLAEGGEKKRLGGMSHGVSGIAWALSEWSALSGDENAKRLVEEACSYEHSLFDNTSRTWRDARSNAPVFHWCHGAVGIGLAASNMRSTLGKMVCDHVLVTAQEASSQNGLMNNHCLCHGNLGNAEIFLSQGDHGRSMKILSGVLDDYKNIGFWRCGLPGRMDTPGLLGGTAGIGYSLLRHASPEIVPNILTLSA